MNEIAKRYRDQKAAPEVIALNPDGDDVLDWKWSNYDASAGQIRYVKRSAIKAIRDEKRIMELLCEAYSKHNGSVNIDAMKEAVQAAKLVERE